MNQSKYLLEQIIANAPGGDDDSFRDPHSGCDHVWYRVSVPVLRGLCNEWVKTNLSSMTYNQWEATLNELYQGKSIDERQLAGFLMAKCVQFRHQIPLTKLEEWLESLEGWKEVDATCQSTFTELELLENWDQWEPFLQKLSVDVNINKRRASLVLLVKPIRSGNAKIVKLALGLVDRLKHEDHILITKAISWLLRTASTKSGEKISAYLEAEADNLPAIVVRETRKKLSTGKK